MRGVASIRTETHLRRFLHGIRLFCNAHSPPKALSPQNLFLSQKHAPIFQSTLLPLPIRALHRPISLRSIRAFVALFRCAQYGLLLRYCPHSGAMRSAAPAMCSLLRRLRAYAYATRPIALGNTGQSNIIHPIHIKMILNSKHNSILSLLKTTHNDLHS